VKKVLIVDESLEGLLVLREMMTRPFITLLETSSGRQAIEIHRRENVDLIVMPLTMTGTDGETVTRTIRASAAMRHVSILMFSDDARDATRDRCLAAGANEFVSRPFHSVDVMTRVARLLDIADRKKTQLLAHVDVHGGSPAIDQFVARIVNLSATGLLLEADAALEIGRQLSLSFFVPGTRTRARAGAVVVRRVDGSNAVRWGVRFTTLDEVARQALKHYVTGGRGST
jgi:two-component system, cell cycle response regulator DivK